MKKILIERNAFIKRDLSLEKNKKVLKYDEFEEISKSYRNKRAELKHELASLKKYIDINIENRLEKITSVWAFITAILSYDFLTFWCANALDSFLITMFCSVPVSTIAFYTFEIVFYNKIAHFLSRFNRDLERLFDQYDKLNDDIVKINKDIEVIESSKKIACNQTNSIDEDTSKIHNVDLEPNQMEEKKPIFENIQSVTNNFESRKEKREVHKSTALSPMEAETVIMEGFTFRSKNVKNENYNSLALSPMEAETVIMEGFTFGKRKVKKR